MITDEQVKLAANIYIGKPVNHLLASGNMTDMRKALEEYEAGKWNDTETVLPTKTGTYITDVGLVYFDADEVIWYLVNANGYPNYDISVAYWQHLPTFKE